MLQQIQYASSFFLFVCKSWLYLVCFCVALFSIYIDKHLHEFDADSVVGVLLKAEAAILYAKFVAI